jgi:biotin carboxyl carrier protein
MKHRIRIDQAEETCEVSGAGSRYEVVVGRERLVVQIDACCCMGDFPVRVNGEVVPIRLGGIAANALLSGRPVVQEFGGRERLVSRAAVGEAGATGAPARSVKRAASGEVLAMMPGVIVRTLVTAGEVVEKGDVLLVLEAMKMENEIKAPFSGRVAEVFVATGQSVAKGQALARIEDKG